jgi:L-aminopeptidase/D-esterase-like protein
MITDVVGVRVGHWTDEEAQTGCTVVRFPDGTVASGEVRGGAPATREFALLAPDAMVERIDAVVLTGGSAFGLAAADGVMSGLEAEGVGYPTAGGPVPIVVAIALYDLAVGDSSRRPGAAEGRLALETVSVGPVRLGLVGAGTGATTAKWRGVEHRLPGGLVSTTHRHGELVVSALVAVNAFGEVGADPAAVVAGSTEGAFMARQNTTIGVVATNARLSKTQCHLVAQSAHDGLARAVSPAHTSADGDAFVAAATGQVDAEVDQVRLLAAHVVEQAISTLTSA